MISSPSGRGRLAGGCITLLLLACQPAPPASLSPQFDVRRALRSPSGQEWADAMQSLSRPGAQPEIDVAIVASALRDESAVVRRRAAMAIALLGPGAVAAAPDLIQALADADTGVQAEAVF